MQCNDADYYGVKQTFKGKFRTTWYWARQCILFPLAGFSY